MTVNESAARLLLAMIVLGILRGNPAPARSGLAFPVAQTNPIMILEPFVVVEQPVGLFHDGDERLFVVERKGRILIVQSDGIIQPEPFVVGSLEALYIGGRTAQWWGSIFLPISVPESSRVCFHPGVQVGV